MSKAFTYAVVLDPQPEGGFTVTVPALPEVVSQGETEEEALHMIREAIELALEVRVERGEQIPPAAGTVLRHVTVAVAA